MNRKWSRGASKHYMPEIGKSLQQLEDHSACGRVRRVSNQVSSLHGEWSSLAQYDRLVLQYKNASLLFPKEVTGKHACLFELALTALEWKICAQPANHGRPLQQYNIKI